jgi:membrane AbrB-like protein
MRIWSARRMTEWLADGRELTGFARALLIAVPAALLFQWVHAPLPWLIGPLAAIGALSAFGVRLACPDAIRSAGLWAIGTALGLYFTPQVVGQIAGYSWAIAVAICYAIGLGLAFAWALRRWGRLDPATAFFAGSVGGASVMAVQGERQGGDVGMIAAAHSLRVVLVVGTLPFIYKWLGLMGSDAYVAGRIDVSYPGLALLVAATCVGALALKRLGLSNPWVMGPLLVAGILTAAQAAPTALPGWVINLGQVFIGISLGTRFEQGFFARAPRAIAVMAVITALGIAVSAGFGYLLGSVAGIAPATMILATSPGGIAEMSLTAKVLHLGVPVVTTFHVLRLSVQTLASETVYRWLARRAGWPLSDVA